MRSVLIVPVLLSALASFVACGGDDTSDDATPSGSSSGGDGGSSGTGTGSSSGGGTGSSSGDGGSSGVAPLPGTPTLTRSVWQEGLQHPWDLVFLPSGSALIAERGGRISRRSAEGATAEVDGPKDVRAQGEGGLLGMTLDPEFADNRFVYTCFAHTGEENDVRVVRWRLSADETELQERNDLVTGMPYTSGRHSGCRLLFAEGVLYVGTGDAAIASTPQDKFSLGGKVLRITRDGAAAPGNPETRDRDSRLYTYGHRNVQGLAQHPVSGRVYSGEHGSNVDDEVNLLEAGGNYGWDPGAPYNENVPMTDLEKFPDAVTAVWSSGDPTTALSGITFLAHPSWRDWTNALVGAELRNQRLRLLQIDAEGTGSSELTELYADQRVRLRTPVLGPDGALYVLTDGKTGGDEIWRIEAE